ncbi:HAD-IIB family hydrolase [Deinococcus puniceus]|uniref:Haloacid dehalogenase n=1 Tax=Deinococcus puniceus TaxID=1182568 RepID=A0A172T789_9DEIO|nr:HAD family hydrolase [Deinococcus puniceus]ANE42915.1 haloacid dehalogenase [Deinococcus puniceus]
MTRRPPTDDFSRQPPATLPLLVAFDLDGTLIADGARDIPVATAEALARLKALGVQVAIITGRDLPPDAVREAVQPDAVATNNGGRIEIGGTLHQESRFGPGDLEAVLAHELDDARIVLFAADCIYFDIPEGVQPEPWMLLRTHKPLSEAPHDDILKVGFYHLDVAALAGRLRQSHPHLVLTGAQPPYPHFLTVTPDGAHKGAALTLIAQALNVPLERTIAFGDSDNDEAMLEVAGHAVQVGTLPLLAQHAHQQVPNHLALAEYLNGLAERVEGQ